MVRAQPFIPLSTDRLIYLRFPHNLTIMQNYLMYAYTVYRAMIWLLMIELCSLAQMWKVVEQQFWLLRKSQFRFLYFIFKKGTMPGSIQYEQSIECLFLLQFFYLAKESLKIPKSCMFLQFLKESSNFMMKSMLEAYSSARLFAYDPIIEQFISVHWYLFRRNSSAFLKSFKRDYICSLALNNFYYDKKMEF